MVAQKNLRKKRKDKKETLVSSYPFDLLITDYTKSRFCLLDSIEILLGNSLYSIPK
jgi:hypothetical protein